MTKHAVRTFIRVRPALSNFIETREDKRTVQFQPGADARQCFQFRFDGVLQDASQDDVYKECVRDVVDGVLDGFNGTVMCYGQTGAGKTFSMTGPKDQYRQRGIIPRVLHHIFLALKGDPALFARTTVRISHVEIYNESLYDLLDLTTQPSEMSLVEDGRGRIHIRGVNAPVVNSEAEALSAMFEGERNRSIGEHQLNRESSRSHVIFTIVVERKEGDNANDPKLVSKLNLVDLAGSERVCKTKSEGIGLKEAGAINRSLSMLERVILALADRHRDHIPYRASKLTHLLKDSLGGNCRTVMIANVWGDPEHCDETVSTSRFAQRTQRVQNVLVKTYEEDDSQRVKQLEREIELLKGELAMHDVFARRSGIEYGPYNTTQRAKLKEQVHQYLENPDPDSRGPLELLNLRHVQEILRTVKILHKSSGGSRPDSDPPPQSSAKNNFASDSSDTQLLDSRQGQNAADDDYDSDDCVGDLDSTSQGCGVGIAPANARPVQTSTESPSRQILQAPQGDRCCSSGEMAAERRASCSRASSTQKSGGGSSESLFGRVQMTEHPSARHVPDKETAFEDYKAGPGKATATLLVESKTALKKKKKRGREISIQINKLKRHMDELTAEREHLRKQRPSQDNDRHKDEAASSGRLAHRIRDLKSQYRDMFTDLQMVKSEVAYTANLVNQYSQELSTEFKRWFRDTYGEWASDVGNGKIGSFSTPPDVESEAASSLWSLKSSSSSRRSKGTKVLSSLLDRDDPEASMYYNAQRMMCHHQCFTSANAKVALGLGPPRRQTSRKVFIL